MAYSKCTMRIQQLEKAERYMYVYTFHYFKLADSRTGQKVESRRFCWVPC